tara:strand:+ start:1572 stop:3641 length:2070 start_codon:yes stop_codon:yes gene_type:complete
MDKLNILLWYRSSKLGESGKKIIEFEKKVVSYIEKDINANGGIGGLGVDIDFIDIPHIAAGHDKEAMEFYKNVVNSKNYSFIRAPGAFGGVAEVKKKYLEEMKSSTSIIFSDFFAAPLLNLSEHNIIDMRSNLFTDADISYSNRARINKELLEKSGRTFFIANFSAGSKYWDEEEELKKAEIFLFDIDKELHKDNKKLELDLANFFDSFEASKSDIVHLGGVPVYLIQSILNCIQKYNNEILIYTRPAGVGEAYLNYQEIYHPIILIEDANFDIYLSMESMIETIGVDLSIKEKQMCNQRFSQFEIPLLVKKVTDRDKIIFDSQEDMVKKVINSINQTDGKKDIYMGISRDYSFSENKNNTKSGALVELSLPSQDQSNPIKTLHKNQISIVDGKEIINSVITFNIDVERITNVSIEDGTFGAEFYIDITSKNEEPLNSIRFNNLSSLNPKHEVRKIEQRKSDELFSARYIITSNFDFNPIADNYPFDEQFIYISISGTDQNSQIQPVPEQYLDNEFKCDGWSIIYSKSGINRKKNWIALNSNLNKSPKINEEIRLGWELKRQNSMTLLKIGIPLFFLYVLVYYTLFLGVEESGTALGYLTTAFLSSIALYFSTERPQPLSMTTIDVVFAFFYIISGISLLMIVFSQFFVDLYAFLIYPLRAILPLSILGLGLFIRNRLSSKKFNPSITK